MLSSSSNLLVTLGRRHVAVRSSSLVRFLSTTPTDASIGGGETTKIAPANSPPVFNKIACIGGGMMAQALLQPMIAGNIQPPEKFTVYDTNVATLDALSEKHGVNTAETMESCLEDADLILVAVKPQNVNAEFLDILKHNHASGTVLLSVVAGTPMETFKRSTILKIVRSMPNTPATVGQGMTVWSATQTVTTKERKKIETILNSCGVTMYVDDESFLDMSTSISGSGPAYIFMLMEAMVDAGVHMGFSRDQASLLVHQTMLGSTLYAMRTKEHPAILRNRVTSPAGTTASALYELENGKFRTVIKDAMWACYRRSLEMGKMDSNVGPGRVKTDD